MSDIVLLDTSVYLNVLDVPGWNQDRIAILSEFEQRVQANNHFLLPLATVWETGNHVASLGNGGLRRKYAAKLVEDVKKAVSGDAPYRPTYFPPRDEFLRWLEQFPDYAQCNKSPTKTTEGIGLADMSIIKEWERACALHRMFSVLIWSLDESLKSYHRAR